MSIKSVVVAVLNEARQLSDGSLAGVRAAACKIIDAQSGPGDLIVGPPGRCPDPQLADMWREYATVARESLEECGEYESYMVVKDFERVLVVAPQLAPEWYQRMLKETKVQREPCAHCHGRGWVARKV